MTRKLRRFYTNYELTTLCDDCAAARQANGEYVQWAEMPAGWELAELTCYDCDGPNDATDDGRPPDEDQIRLECTFWVPGPGTCGWTGLASDADWCSHFETWVCPQCAASDGLRIIAETTDAEPTCHKCGIRSPRFYVRDPKTHNSFHLCRVCKQTVEHEISATGQVNTHGWHYHREYKARFAKLVAAGKLDRAEFERLFAEVGV
jgi:Zn ribbon nucleic-acid-binding protein